MSNPTDDDQAVGELVESNARIFEKAAPVEGEQDNRKFPRFSFRGRARALVFSDKPGEEPKECEVVTTDLSRAGLSLLHRRQLFPGQQILLVLNDTSRLVEVIWCCRVWAGLYSAGCRFVGVSADQTDQTKTSH
jgi:hypothetical protein